MVSPIGSVSSTPLSSSTSKPNPGTAVKPRSSADADSAYTLELSNSGASSSLNASDTVSYVRSQAQASSDALKSMVEKLIQHQTSHTSTTTSVSLSFNMEILNITTNNTAGEGAASAAMEDGDWGVEAVSDRIVSFAKALADNDPSKIDTLRTAIDKGFASAKKALGGSLPDISSQTYDAVMSKLDDWATNADTVDS